MPTLGTTGPKTRPVSLSPVGRKKDYMTIIGKIKKWFGSSTKGNEVNAPGIKLFIPKEDLRSFYPESEFVVSADEEMISGSPLGSGLTFGYYLERLCLNT
jgi:hypothetical protein